MIYHDLTGDKGNWLVLQALRRQREVTWLDRVNAWFWRILGA